jgi:hypothetical protein
MEPLPFEPVFSGNFLVYFFISVNFVCDNRISDSGHVNADLVGTAGEELDFKQRVFVFDMMEKCEFRLRKFWIHRIFSRHSFTIIRVPSDKGLDHPFFVFHNSDYDCIVEFLYLTICHFSLEFFHGTVILRDENQSTRILVEPVDDSRTFYTIYDREFSEMI